MSTIEFDAVMHFDNVNDKIRCDDVLQNVNRNVNDEVRCDGAPQNVNNDARCDDAPQCCSTLTTRGGAAARGHSKRYE
jgi:hypothetical protein